VCFWHLVIGGFDLDAGSIFVPDPLMPLDAHKLPVDGRASAPGADDGRSPEWDTCRPTLPRPKMETPVGVSDRAQPDFDPCHGRRLGRRSCVECAVVPAIWGRRPPERTQVSGPDDLVHGELLNAWRSLGSHSG
jgi:hypothetical protein